MSKKYYELPVIWYRGQLGQPIKAWGAANALS